MSPSPASPRQEQGASICVVFGHKLGIQIICLDFPPSSPLLLQHPQLGLGPTRFGLNLPINFLHDLGQIT